MQPHLGSVVWCLAGIAWLGSKFFGAFTLLVVIIELEDGLKSRSLAILAIFLWCILSLCLMWVGINLYFISNQVLIKFDQLKC
jgi:hypothetical protein